ncbi:nuclear transport factor 2 family protein [Muricauda sp. 2012CJ35-5]|uniref:Nuclear transport factor 2 family protein n=1 Tax=Flagellimonas spongiicola TaxID=2942208 RepID=A0ABT0PSY0_9FLAO|nr:nuclear transport factor 2 family protein [Allomuricauda spongiicola]MCL6274493.1 nuclear transport factor 2 family protein [Allomuricauda spongiicola]
MNLKIVIFSLILVGCQPDDPTNIKNVNFEKDQSTLFEMIALREKAMLEENIESIMPQFTEDATWINSQGYLFEGKKEMEKFHRMFAENDSLDYYYETGAPKIRFLDESNALAYYSWKMFWFKKEQPTDTTYREIGLMTLSAQRKHDGWKWVAVTNQHTPWFYPKIEAVQVD